MQERSYRDLTIKLNGTTTIEVESEVALRVPDEIPDDLLRAFSCDEWRKLLGSTFGSLPLQIAEDAVDSADVEYDSVDIEEFGTTQSPRELQMAGDGSISVVESAGLDWGA